MNQFICGRRDVALAARAPWFRAPLLRCRFGWMAALLVLIATLFAGRAHAEVATVSPCVLESSTIEPCYATAEAVARAYVTRIRGGLMGYEITGVRCQDWRSLGERELYRTCYVDYRWLAQLEPLPKPPVQISETMEAGAWTCKEQFRFMPKVGCVGVEDRYHSDQCTPSVGNPIQLLRGTKREVVVLDDALPLTLAYSSERNLLAASHTSAFTYLPPKSFGMLWEASSHRQIFPRLGGGDVLLARGAGHWRQFSMSNGQYVDRGNSADRLDWGSGWRYFDRSTNVLEVYSNQGRLLSISPAGGGRQDYVYSDANTPSTIAPSPGLLIEVRDHQGRVARFTYLQPADSGANRYLHQLRRSEKQLLLRRRRKPGSHRLAEWR
jgi:hypothetical protein